MPGDGCIIGFMMGIGRLVGVACVGFLAIGSDPVRAWGPTGHRVVGELAQRRLTPEARSELKKLEGGRSLAQVANWADFVKSDSAYDRYRPWHYVNMEKGKDYHASKKSKDGDLIRAILHFEDRLRDKALSSKDRKEALRFLIHFIGDLHQPLHVGYAKDRGGNGVRLRWFGDSTNLHHL